MIRDAPSSERLEDVASIAAGYPLRGSAEALDEGDTAFIQLKNVDFFDDVHI